MTSQKSTAYAGSKPVAVAPRAGIARGTPRGFDPCQGCQAVGHHIVGVGRDQQVGEKPHVEHLTSLLRSSPGSVSPCDLPSNDIVSAWSARSSARRTSAGGHQVDTAVGRGHLARDGSRCSGSTRGSSRPAASSWRRRCTRVGPPRRAAPAGTDRAARRDCRGAPQRFGSAAVLTKSQPCRSSRCTWIRGYSPGSKPDMPVNEGRNSEPSSP